jgi:hypothetical protein
VPLNYRRFASRGARVAAAARPVYDLQPDHPPHAVLHSGARAIHCGAHPIPAESLQHGGLLLQRRSTRNVSYPQDSWNWDDFLATAKAMTRDVDGDGAIDQYGLSVDPMIIRAAPFVWQNGGELVFNPSAPTRLSLDKPEAKEALQWFIDLQLVHHVVPPLEEAKSEDPETRFLNGRAAMYIDSRRFANYARERELDWTWLPRGGRRPPSCTATPTA